jgi:lysyl-tRNA synthetase class 2
MNAAKDQRSPWWTPSVHADRRPFLIGRNAIVKALRQFFDARGFLEVDPAALQVSPGNETHLHPFRTEAILPDLSRQELYLHTSPEFACKKLLAAGETRIACFAHVWRNRERSALHHPEFTMLEWYRAGEDLDALMKDSAEMLALAAETTGTRSFNWRGKACDPFATPEKISVADAFERFAGIDLFASIDADGGTERDRLAADLVRIGMRVGEDDNWSDLFSRVMVEKVDPNLGLGRPTFLHDYPVAEAALARRSAHDRRVADRFELFCANVELANAFGELTDADEQRRRFQSDMDLKQQIYGERVPLDEDFLAALAVMPAASGIALGLDRLVMLATGAVHIEQVLWAPVPSP